MTTFKETSMAAVFQNQVAKFGKRACVAYKKDDSYVDISWKALDEMVKGLAGFLISKGIRRGDHVAIFSPNR